MSGGNSTLETPLKWRFTWEAQSHIPTLRLFLFDSHTNPSLQCRNLRVLLNLSRSEVLVTWSDGDDVSLLVPMPRVLIDGDSPVSFTTFEDHIEVKLVLLLPVGHPIVSGFDSILNSSADDGADDSDSSKPLSVDSDVERLIASGGVHFYCRNCGFNLTRTPLCGFVEMPSVNWREVADNWFGACCCSFGGISEKMVTQFANTYTCAKGVCLLDFATATLCKDDLVKCNFNKLGRDPGCELKSQLPAEPGCGQPALHSNINDRCTEKLERTTLDDKDGEECCTNVPGGIVDEISNIDRLFHLRLESDSSAGDNLLTGCCTQHVSEIVPHSRKFAESTEILENQKSFLNGFLGNIFMVRSSNLSKDVEWVEYKCPQCSNLLGAYPCGDSFEPVDGGVRFFKCYISTCLSCSGAADLFRGYTLERMFTNQLLDIAKDELSYRTVIRDLETEVPMLQVVIVNANSWSCSGHCFSSVGRPEEVPKTNLQPVIKVLFTECSTNKDWDIRAMEDQISKGLVDEIFMLRHQIEEMIESLVSQRNAFPASYSSLQGLLLSSMKI